MQMVFIQMRTDDHLKTLTEQPSGELHANSVGLLWGQLTRFERLDDVIALYAARLVVAPLGAIHIATAIQTAFK
jgi:hypothetical protein